MNDPFKKCSNDVIPFLNEGCMFSDLIFQGFFQKNQKSVQAQLVVSVIRVSNNYTNWLTKNFEKILITEDNLSVKSSIEYLTE